MERATQSHSFESQSLIDCTVWQGDGVNVRERLCFIFPFYVKMEKGEGVLPRVCI